MTEQIAIQTELRNYLTEAQVKNSAYSLRAFSRKLQISASSLSEILQGKRKVSAGQAEKILRNMGSSPREVQNLLSLFGKESNQAGPASLKSNGNPLQLTSDQFHAIGDWYHFAILSLSETKGFKADPLWIAKRLGIKVPQAEAALERLVRLKLVVWRRTQKTLKLSNERLSTSDEVLSQAVRKSHHHDLQLAAEVLVGETSGDDIRLRDFTSMTMAIDVMKIPEAKKMIRDFQRKLSAFMETGQQTEVYKVCVHLFPLSKEVS